MRPRAAISWDIIYTVVSQSLSATYEAEHDVTMLTRDSVISAPFLNRVNSEFYYYSTHISCLRQRADIFPSLNMLPNKV